MTTKQTTRLLPALLLPLLLITTLALRCADSIPTAVEEHTTVVEEQTTSAASEDVAASKGQPTNTDVLRDTFPGDEICGIPVTTEYFRAGATWENDLPGNPPLKETGTSRWTWTTADGKSVQLQSSGNATREITEWIDESTFRATETITGAPSMFKTPHGPVLSHDVGRIVFGFLVQLQEGGGFILLEPPMLLEVSGPHPEAESNFTIFCEIVTEALM